MELQNSVDKGWRRGIDVDVDVDTKVFVVIETAAKCS